MKSAKTIILHSTAQSVLYFLPKLNVLDFLNKNHYYLNLVQYRINYSLQAFKYFKLSLNSCVTFINLFFKTVLLFYSGKQLIFCGNRCCFSNTVPICLNDFYRNVYLWFSSESIEHLKSIKLFLFQKSV